jgi:hypothetical protein
LHGVACLVGGEVVLQRGVLKVAHAAPEIQLPGVDAQTDLVTAAGRGLAGEAEVAGRPAPARIPQPDAGQALGTLNTMKRTRLLNL